ncbi:MAG: SDR family oxidoreductase [Actinobacteria bacterium]|nr:SDR family oxidoreductase [Actinomycetota bacterium]
MKQINLKDKISLVVGGAGDIGSGIVKALAAAQSKILVADIDDVSGERLAKSINAEFKVETHFYKCDITKRAEVKKIIKEIYDKFKNIDVLVYSAGYSSFAEFIDLTDKEWDRSMEINLRGAFYFIQEAMPHMLAAKKGNIVLVGSTTSINGSGGGAHYAVSKIGLLGLMKSITYDLLQKGVRINIVSPGVIDTKMLRIRYPDTPEVNKKIIEGIPLGRMGTPEDIGNIVAFLASDMAEYICGQEIIADGGRIIYKRPK